MGGKKRLEKYRERALNEAFGWTDDESHVTALTWDPETPILLIEGSTRDSRFWMTLHASLPAAVRYSLGQEYAGDWAIDFLVDLTTGIRYTAQFDDALNRFNFKETT
jgi:hypothetical protein